MHCFKNILLIAHRMYQDGDVEAIEEAVAAGARVNCAVHSKVKHSRSFDRYLRVIHFCCMITMNPIS
jgi:5-methylcytosine-specific restriction endonuclease McrBC regulatory subunit McrC